jgi:hypothetical protein
MMVVVVVMMVVMPPPMVVVVMMVMMIVVVIGIVILSELDKSLIAGGFRRAFVVGVEKFDRIRNWVE